MLWKLAKFKFKSTHQLTFFKLSYLLSNYFQMEIEPI